MEMSPIKNDIVADFEAQNTKVEKFALVEEENRRLRELVKEMKDEMDLIVMTTATQNGSKSILFVLTKNNLTLF